MPSAGSVPEPNSSMITRLSRFTSPKTSSTFLICAEKVERFSAMSCPSPMSHRYPLFMQISADVQVTWSPHCAMIQQSMTVLIATVFPPVFGPVMIMPLACFPISNCRGTLIFLSINGCLASVRTIRRSVLIMGSTASRSMLSFPFEKIKSSFSIIRIFSFITVTASATIAVSVYRIRQTSFSSLIRSSCSSS